MKIIGKAILSLLLCSIFFAMGGFIGVKYSDKINSRFAEEAVEEVSNKSDKQVNFLNYKLQV